MADRSDREQGQPNRCPRRNSLMNRMGPCSRTPSGPAVSNRLHQQAGQKTAPDQCHCVNLTLATREPSTEDIASAHGMFANASNGSGPTIGRSKIIAYQLGKCRALYACCKGGQ